MKYDRVMSSRKRVSVRQIELLVEFLEAHRNLAHSRLKNKEALATYSHLWAKCAKVLNADKEGDPRTPKQWNKWYNDYKCRTLQRIRQNRQSQSGISGGTVSVLTPLEDRLATLLGISCEVGMIETPMKSEDNILIYVEDSAQNISESEPESTVSSTPASPLRQQDSQNLSLNSQAPPETSFTELERLQNQVTALETSRIEVERQMAAGYNKMADAVDKMADAANKSASALCQIAEALGKIGQAVENSGIRWRIIATSEEDD